jgi:REP element-mobilizing transposase RayT
VKITTTETGPRQSCYNGRKRAGRPCYDRKDMITADPSLKIVHGARLPHWTRENACYAVTFRLESWDFERRDLINTAKQLGRPLTRYEEKRLDALFSEKVDKYLDEGQGKCRLREDRIVKVVASAFEFFNELRYCLFAWCVMPNHVHVVLHPFPGHELPRILHTWKSYTAKEINRILGTKGEFWGVEYYDHLIRDERDFNAQIEYVLANPQKAGLHDWKWMGVTRDGDPKSCLGARL